MSHEITYMKIKQEAPLTTRWNAMGGVARCRSENVTKYTSLTWLEGITHGMIQCLKNYDECLKNFIL